MVYNWKCSVDAQIISYFFIYIDFSFWDSKAFYFITVVLWIYFDTGVK